MMSAMTLDAAQRLLDRLVKLESRITWLSARPDLEAYNGAVDSVAEFVAPELTTCFGAKTDRPRPAEFYERANGWPEPEPRTVFRVDTFEHSEHGTLFRAFVSGDNPEGYLDYAKAWILEGEAPKLVAIGFLFTRGEHPQWRLQYGDASRFRRADGSREFDWDGLGKLVTTVRLNEPNQELGRLYHNDDVAF